MIFEEYEIVWIKIRKIEKELFEYIEKRDILFEKTQPKSPKLDKEMVDGKNPTNLMEQYMIQKEYLNEKINQCNTALDDLYQVLKRKRDELKLSKNLYDKIYYYYCIERLSIYKISYLMSYSESQIYRKLKKMGIEVKMQKNAKKNSVL